MLDNDPQYLSMRLRGLASLLDSARKNEADAAPLDTDALFFVSQELYEVAGRLDGGK